MMNAWSFRPSAPSEFRTASQDADLMNLPPLSRILGAGTAWTGSVAGATPAPALALDGTD